MAPKSKDFKNKPKRRNHSSRKPKNDSKTNHIEDSNIDVTGKGLPSHNDPSWYKYDETMFHGVIQMPTLEFKGKNILWKESDATGGISLPENYIKPPLVSAYYMNPSAGPGSAPQNSAEQYNNPINVAARAMYAQLSASNAKTSQYAPQDIATLILMLGQIIAMITHYKRVYKICSYFNFYNRRVPDTLLEACNIRINASYDIRQNLSDYRARLNQMIARVNTIKFPSNLNYFKKCGYIYDNVFVDRDDEMPTFQLMVPYSTWIMDETASSQGTVLVTQELDTNTYTYHLNLLGDMIEQVLTSSTFNYIYADIINLANRGVINDPLITIPMLDIDESITPLYSEQFNWQVMNMTILGPANAPDLTDKVTPNNDVYPNVDTSALAYAPRFRVGSTLEQILRDTAVKPPVRLPNTNVSQDEFVELLAYYNSAGLDMYEPTTGDPVVSTWCTSVTDYYCVNCKVWFGDGTSSHLYRTPHIDNILHCGVLNVVHAPFFYAGYVEGGNVVPISKLGSFTQVDDNALSNLRFETYLGLFKFE